MPDPRRFKPGPPMAGALTAQKHTLHGEQVLPRDTSRAMSKENVEIVRRCLETYEADEEAWLQTLDPEVEWHPIGDGHIRRVGLDAAVAVRRRWLESWDDHRLDVEEVKGGGAGVVVGTRISGKGKGSGLDVD